MKGLHIFIQPDVLVGLGSLWLEDFCLFFRLFLEDKVTVLSSLYRGLRQPPGSIGPFKPPSILLPFWGEIVRMAKDLFTGLEKVFI